MMEREEASLVEPTHMTSAPATARSNATMSVTPPPPGVVQPSTTPTPQTLGLTQRAKDQMNDGESSSKSSNNSSLKDTMQEHEQDDMLDAPSDSEPPDDWEAGLDDLHPGSVGQQ
ncbi:hypothetical protein EV182_008900 [Spiromyces aspiralis]|uniref:Uncharacterized protein n=1 Tax=Spiromyces aspiralis TaxID=68401 RepID=A0ACC1HL45_9FUNG|nr:hypothetical protein EV182_008900 [Spiromyces aspiralis]